MVGHDSDRRLWVLLLPGVSWLSWLPVVVPMVISGAVLLLLLLLLLYRCKVLPNLRPGPRGRHPSSSLLDKLENTRIRLLHDSRYSQIFLFP